TRYVYEIEHLLEIGANEVIPEEFETSLEILARTLHEYQISRRVADQAILNFRTGAYKALRQNAPVKKDRDFLKELSFSLEIETVKIRSEDPVVGKTLQEIMLP